MSENICSHVDCNNKIYNDNKECIFHCAKQEFDDNDISEFWKLLRVFHSFNHNTSYHDTDVPVTFENIKFPKFEQLLSRNKIINFCYYDIYFKANVSFINCTFFDKCDLMHNNFQDVLLFTDCIFYSDISNGYINKMILSDCEFINDSKIENNSCKNIEVKNTQFNKPVEIKVLEDIKIDENSIFIDMLILNGNRNSDICCQNSQFDKEVFISDSKTIKLLGLNLKSNIDLGENIEKLEIKNCSTGILELNNINEISFTNLISPSIDSIGGKCENVLIESSKIGEINLNASSYEKISIQNNTESKAMKINNSTNAIISDSSINDIRMLGENYNSLSVKNTNISSLFKANSISDILFDNVKMNPKIVLNENTYPKIIFKDSYLDSLMISPEMFLDDTISNGNNIIKFQNTTIRNDCKISKVMTLQIVDSEFNGLFTVDNCNNVFSIEDSEFKGSVIFNSSKFHKIEIENICCSDIFSFLSAQIDNLTIRGLNAESNKFASLVDFSKSIVKSIDINSSIFKDELKIEDVTSIPLSSISNNTINKFIICNSQVTDLFRNSKSLNIDTLMLDNVKLNSIDERWTIDLKNIEINQFKCNKLSILKELNFDEVKINHFTIANSNIEKKFRIKYSQIIDTFFTDTTFEDLQLIDNKNDDFIEKREFRLKNTTIKSTVLDKLKLDNFNMKDAHVSDAKIGYVKFQKGSRETNRFFKNYYDSISDYIKADEYYRDEMEEQRKISKGFEKINLMLNKVISNFGQSWIRPFGLIFGLGIIFYILFHFQMLTTEGYLFNHKMMIWNNFWEFMNPFSKKATEEYQDVYGWWMIHKLLTTVLIYHFIIAIKRKTKR